MVPSGSNGLRAACDFNWPENITFIMILGVFCRKMLLSNNLEIIKEQDIEMWKQPNVYEWSVITIWTSEKVKKN